MPGPDIRRVVETFGGYQLCQAQSEFGLRKHGLNHYIDKLRKDYNETKELLGELNRLINEGKDTVKKYEESGHKYHQKAKRLLNELIMDADTIAKVVNGYEESFAEYLTDFQPAQASITPSVA